MASTIDWEPDQSVHDGPNGQAEPTFIIEWAPRIDGPTPRKGPPRSYHKKSRTGCAQCRARRVKCDEIHPICGHCQRHTGECTYDRPNTAKMNASSSSLVDMTRSVAISKSISSKKAESPVREIPESKARRLLELRLLHHFMAETSKTLTDFTGNMDTQKYWWTIAWPRKALENDALLNSVFTIAALHWAKVEPHNEVASEAHRKYLDLALSCHRDDVASLNKRNADAVCLTSTLVRVCIFSGFSARDLEPYTPPFAWLKSIQASGQVWASSWKWIKDDETAVAGALFKSTPVLMDPALLFSPNNRKGLNHLLRSNLEEDAAQLANPKFFSAYETTVNYIGGIKLAIAAGQPQADMLKRLATFPMWINRNFTPLVEEGQPRALVILCHYFALLTKFKDRWWLGDTGEREIRAIEKILPRQWLPLMAWPMQVLQDPSVLGSMPSPEDAEAKAEPDQLPRRGSADLSKPFGAGFRGE